MLQAPVAAPQPAPPAATPAPAAAPAATPAPAVAPAATPAPAVTTPASTSAPPAVAATPPELPAYSPHGPSDAKTPAVAPAESTLRTAKWEARSDIRESHYTIGKGLTLATKDGRFSLNLRGRLQFRYDANRYHDDDPATAPADHALQIRRLRLILQGNVFSPHVKYHLQFGFAPLDMYNDLPADAGIRRSPLRDVRVEFDRLRDFTVWIGQRKVSFSRQRMLSSSAMNMVDRSITNAEFNLDRDIGVQAMSKDLGGLGHRLSYYVGVFMGEGRNAFIPSDFGLMYVGRVELAPFGKFDDHSEGDLGRTRTPGLSIGGAYSYQDRAHAARGVVGDYPLDLGTTDFHHVTTDILFKWKGLSLVTAFHLRKGFNRINGGALDADGNPIATVAARSGIGWFGQLGYVVPKLPLEVVGRYGLIRNPYHQASSMISSDEAGGGLNWYIVGHDLKVQLDYFRLWDETKGTTPLDAARHGTDRVRVQIQVYF